MVGAFRAFLVRISDQPNHEHTSNVWMQCPIDANRGSDRNRCKAMNVLFLEIS